MILAAVLGVGCGLLKEEQARGGGLEGETLTLSGQAVYADGSPAVSARVRLRSADFPEHGSADTGEDTLTGPDGRYVFTGVHPGDFILILNDKDSLARFREVSAGDQGADARLLELGVDTLKSTGTLSGRVLLTPGAPAINGHVKIPMDGSPFPIDSTGRIFIKGVPPGIYFMRIVYDSPAMIHKLEGVKVKAGETTDVGGYTLAPAESENVSAWPDSISFHLNTTDSGLSATRNLAGFPLLVRLDSSNFPFEKVGQKKDGADLRFTDSQGRRLAFEMEFWDFPGRRANIWVRLDTLYSRRNDQTLRLHFGNPDVFSPANPGSVFDTSLGLAAVWHFSHYNEGGYLSDATANHNQLMGGNSQNKVGLFGQGRLISAGDELGAPASATQESGSFTLSAWIHSNGTQSQQAAILWKEKPGSSLAAYSLCWLGKEGALEFAVSKDPLNPAILSIKAPVPLDQAWIQIAATYDQASGAGTLYLNGKSMATFKDAAPFIYLGGGALFLGAKTGGLQAFNGILDEVRVERVARTAARIAADYASQKPGSVLVAFP